MTSKSASNINGFWYAPGSSERHEAVLRLYAGPVISVAGDGFRNRFRPEVMTIESRIGSSMRHIRFAGGFHFETMDNDAVDALQLALRRSSPIDIVSILESKLKYALGSVLILGAFVAAVFFLGIPFAGERIASALPQSVNESAEKQTLGILDNYGMGPSALDDAAKKRVERIFERIRTARADHAGFHLILRSGGALGANAFALPGGGILITDEIAALATDEELEAVMAHEACHVLERHGMQMAVRSSITAIISVYFLGDLSGISSAVSSIPVVLLQNGYSRSFERRADAYAAQYLLDRERNPMALIHLLEKLREKNGVADAPGWMSTHPDTDERRAQVKRIMENGMRRP